MTIILFVAVLLVTVIVHEWGHFIVAKKSGMLVEEFGFGIPPRLFSWKRGETVYSVNALPIGGFVKIAGENGLTEEVSRNRQFESKPWFTKSLVLVAGVICNVLLAFVLFAAAYFTGLPGITPDGTPTVLTVVPGSIADISGIEVGDEVKSIYVEGEPISALNTDEIRHRLQQSTGSVVINYSDGNVDKSINLDYSEIGSERVIGVVIEPIGTIKQTLPEAITMSAKQTVSLIQNIFSALAGLVGDLFTGNASTKNLVGPVGLVREVGNASMFGFAYLLAFVATISLNLAVLNILPFPALDGGRLIIVWAEAISGRKFSARKVGLIHAIGFLLLLVLMVVLTVSDVKKII